MATNTLSAEVRPANPNASIVSAEADQRMAMDAMKMAVQAAETTKAQMVREATDSTWESWRERVRRAERVANKAVSEVIATSKAVARVNASTWSVMA